KLISYFYNLGLNFDKLEFDLTNLNKYNVIIVDGSDPVISKKLILAHNMDKLKKFMQNEGKVMVLNMSNDTVNDFNQFVGKELYLSDPYLGETQHCIKAAVSWTKRNSPDKLVQYYHNVLISQPFEPNKDRLISGISNIDLYWNGKDIFTRGVKFKGINPVYASRDYNILISNWKIDWTRPVYGGEYIHETKDIRRANWFINRDPVLLKINKDNGYFLFNQMNLFKGAKKAKRVISQLLTAMGGSIGKETYLKTDIEYELKQREETFKRQQKLDVPDTVEIKSYGDSRNISSEDSELTQILLLGDSITGGYSDYVKEYLKDKAEVYSISREDATTEIALENLQSWLEINDWDVIYFNWGLEDLKRTIEDKADSTGKRQVSPEEFKDNLNEIVRRLKETESKLFWSTITPITEDIAGWVRGEEVEYNKIANEIMDKNEIYINDIHSVIKDQLDEVQKNKSVYFTEKGYEILGKQVGEAIQFFGA
ncbi:MAG: SGNH/GDSL hydrolase family protein, partial [bacterium]